MVQCFYDRPESVGTTGDPFAEFLKIEPCEIVEGSGDTIKYEDKPSCPFMTMPRTYAISDLAAQLQEYSISPDSATKLPKYTSYAQFNQEFMSIREAFDTNKVEEVSYPQFVEQFLLNTNVFVFNPSQMGVSQMVSNNVAARGSSPGFTSLNANQGL